MDLGPDQTRFAEHFAFWSSLSLTELCTSLRERFHLPEVAYGSEDATEWGLILHDGLEYNMSRPYEHGTLQEWDSSVPADCNIGFTLSSSSDAPEPRDAEQGSSALVQRIGQALADLFDQPIHHHRTWLGPGKNVARSQTFLPAIPPSGP